MAISEFSGLDPVQTVEQLGYGIVSSDWSSDEATRKVAGTLMDLLCDSKTIQEDFTVISDSADEHAMTPRHPLFVPLVHTTTRGIFLREDSDDIPKTPTEINIDKMVAHSTEGILWDSPEGFEFRERYTVRTGTLLKGFARGMANAGLPHRTAKALMRQEVVGILDEVGTRIPSYAALNFVLVGSTIVSKAGLATPKSFTKDFTRIIKGFLF